MSAHLEPRWACTVCGGREHEFAPSGRCIGCEAGDLPELGSEGLRQIAQLVDITGLSLRSIRSYEDQGLLHAVGRTKGGFRLYDDATLDRLRLIMKMKPLGFGVEDMRRLLDACSTLAADTTASSVHAVELLEEFSHSVARKTQKLRHDVANAEHLAAALRAEAARLASR
jgi:DNA-binding transcriptional MerR regulator